MKPDKINDYTFQYYRDLKSICSDNIGKYCVRVINKNECPIVIEIGQYINNSVSSIINSIDFISERILDTGKKELSSLGKDLIIRYHRQKKCF